MNTLFQTAAPPKSRLPKLIGYGLATVCLFWVLHDFHIVQAHARTGESGLEVGVGGHGF